VVMLGMLRAVLPSRRTEALPAAAAAEARAANTVTVAPTALRLSSADAKAALPPDLFKARKLKPWTPTEPPGAARDLPAGTHELKIYLPIPPALHNRALLMGAVTDGDSVCVHRNQALNEFQDMLPLAERDILVPLDVDLAPRTSWASSLSTLLSQSSWEALCRPALESSGGRCQICGEKSGHFGGQQKQELPEVGCHEGWRFHGPGRHGVGIQKLRELMVVCRDCHMMFHLLSATANGVFGEVAGRLMAVNRWTEDEMHIYLEAMQRNFDDRSQVEWALDVTGWQADPKVPWVFGEPANPDQPLPVVLGARYRVGADGAIANALPARDWY
jgi:hypothetical protein